MHLSSLHQLIQRSELTFARDGPLRGQQTKDLRFPASIRTDVGFKIRFKSARSAQANSALKIQHSEVDRRMGRRILSRSVHLRKFVELYLAGGSMALLRNRAAASGDVMNLIRSRATVSFFETLRTATPKWPYSISSGGKGPR